jgi:diacylglycerol kinase family enzyme
MTLVANANRYRTGANVNPSGKMDDGMFEVIVIRPHQKWIWHGFVGAFTGTFHKKPNVKVHPCTSVIIKVTPPQELQVDGELLGRTSEIRAKIEKHALNVIR